MVPTTRFLMVLVGSVALLTSTLSAFQPISRSRSGSLQQQHQTLFVVAPEKEESKTANVEETTEKYGLEAGLFESMKSKDGGESAKSLLKKYGIAYLATSIPLAIVSFTICYVLVDSGVDVGALLAKVGIETSSASETAGTAAIAYAAHKAASPIRFPPTVVLTPVVAKLIGKEPEDEEMTRP
ncbi:family with sequence similarity 210, member B [Seminavis robusta]|uniref:Family with sequence similarity 210, member B n=1 Tax=Seminavis robusta TaxID=568900 RepID=A0A9N8H9W7_9STRA|nr:family with sequence similarity 210, member B [Seminavis robusta]|eukprot:Sro295_g110520.1 family with sequence similarity 210, member B (183) ;mRNA; r:61024-61572